MNKIIVTAYVEYLEGYLRKGHYELVVDKDQWDSMSEEEKKIFMEDNGDFLVDDWEIDEIGPITEYIVD